MMWVINPEIDMVSVLEEYGRFLENDYRMIIEHLEIPSTFEEYAESTGRKFIIVGHRETPWVLVKSVFLCLKLAGPESVVVRTPNIDEVFMIQNVFDNYAGDIKTKVFLESADNLSFSDEWAQEIENSTDIIVFGNQNTMEAFREYETVDRRVWEHGFKFSFGIIREEHLVPSIINQICFDFFSFYGEGSLAPKFYFVVGKIRNKHIRQFNDNMSALYGDLIQQYRSKLQFSRRSELISGTIDAERADKYIRLDRLNSSTIFDSLYGDVKLIPVDDLDDVEDFIKKWHDNISSVAINNDDDTEMLCFLEDLIVMRICDIGYIQFPDFFDQYDTVDDFIIYTDEDDMGDPFEDGFI